MITVFDDPLGLPLLSSKEIKSRLDQFNDETSPRYNDYSIFDDVPLLQQVSVMYPHKGKPIKWENK